MPVVNRSDAASGTVTRALEPLKLRAFPYLPDVDPRGRPDLAGVAVPGAVGDRRARSFVERVRSDEVRRRRRRRRTRRRRRNTRIRAHLVARVPRPHPIRITRRRHQTRIRQRRRRGRRHLHEPRATRALTPLHLVRRDTEIVGRRRPRQIHPTRPRRRRRQTRRRRRRIVHRRRRHRRRHTRIRTRVTGRVPRPHPIAVRRPRRPPRITPDSADTVVTAAKLEHPAP